MKKIYTFRGRKGENEFGVQHQYGQVINPSIGNLIKMKKIYAYRGQKGEYRPSKP
jgi:hypothetical protein